ncbi:MAG: hypothetical protein WBE20_09770 [Candidatus Acidiferrales bacterium]
MTTYKGFARAECTEDCPRCNRCPPESVRRMRVDAMITGWELEKLRYQADGLAISWPSPADWHGMVEHALAAGKAAPLPL